MKNKKFIAIALVVVLSLALCLTACSSGETPATNAPSNNDSDSNNTNAAPPEEVFEWRFQSTETDTIAMFRERNEICEKIAEETNGGLIITQYTQGAIISDMNIPDAVMTGTIEMGNVYLNPLYASVPTSNMVGITPGFFFDVANCIYYLKGYGALDIFTQECEEILNCYCYPELTGRAVYLSTVPIVEADDFQGVSIKAYGPLGNILSNLGASVVNLSSSEIYTSLQTGLVDAANWGAYEGAYGASMHEVCDYIIEPALGIGVGTVNMINKDAFDALPEEYQAIVEKYFSERMFTSVLGTDTGEYEARQAMIEAGLEPCELSDECKETIHEMALEEMETLSTANEACGQIYDILLQFLEYKDALRWQ